jgi:hypothetical protein
MPCEQATIILHFNPIFFRIRGTIKKGRVYLVGAGLGDIGLLAVEGLRCFEGAEVGPMSTRI